MRARPLREPGCSVGAVCDVVGLFGVNGELLGECAVAHEEGRRLAAPHLEVVRGSSMMKSSALVILCIVPKVSEYCRATDAKVRELSMYFSFMYSAFTTYVAKSLRGGS